MAVETTMKELQVLSWASKLMVYRNLLKNPVIKVWEESLKEPVLDKEIFINQLFFTLAQAAEEDEPFVVDGWKNRLLNFIAWDENPFTHQAAVQGANLSPALLEAAAHDLKYLHRLYQFFNLKEGEYPWGRLLAGREMAKLPPALAELAAKFEVPKLCQGDYVALAQKLQQHYLKEGTGLFGRYHALRWDGQSQRLLGVVNPDAIRLHQLIGYERQKQELLRNTESFLAGFRANNVLLYGDRGTGKSSLVKALVHAYGAKGLRVIEVQKQDLAQLPMLLPRLKPWPWRFILFIDDLSFEEFEVEYKGFKAVLEGGLEARPDNVLVYATTNRRSLVRQSFSQRQGDDVHVSDTFQEYLSLADRFGLTLTFVAPDKEHYLEMVEALARERGLKISREELHQEALRWELRHSGRSGRVARQFIDYLAGRLLLNDTDEGQR